MVWGFCYLRIFKKVQSISGRSLVINFLILIKLNVRNGHRVLFKQEYSRLYPYL
jgi:hypothetical protein